MKEFTHLYPKSKTLRFELIPIGKTLQNLRKSGVIEADQHRADSYKKMKKTIDEYHKWFVEQALSGVVLHGLDEFYHLYTSKPEDKKDDRFKTKFEKAREVLRKEVTTQFKNQELFRTLDKKELLTIDLEQWRNSLDVQPYFDEEFKRFTTYFKGFHENRKNMYVDEAKSTAIAYRIVHENLPRFIDNMHIFEKVRASAVSESFATIYQELEPYINVVALEDLFCLRQFNTALTQTQIECYNSMIGGKTMESGQKIRGLNEYINLYNQKQTEKKDKLPKLKPLYKQILSDREQLSFLPDAFTSAEELLESMETFYQSLHYAVLHSGHDSIDVLAELQRLIMSVSEYNTRGIYIRNDRAIADLSQRMFGNYGILRMAMSFYYEHVVEPNYGTNYLIATQKKAEKKIEALEKEREQYLRRKYVSVAELQDSFDYYSVYANDEMLPAKVESARITDYFRLSCHVENNEKTFDHCSNINAKYSCVQGLLNISTEETVQKKLTQKEKDDMKVFLDSLMEFFHFAKTLYVETEEALKKDDLFYSAFDALYEVLKPLPKLYDKVRNFATKKPYSTEKYKLTFDCTTLLDGWDVNKESANLSTLFERNGNYYLGIINKANSSVLQQLVVSATSDVYRKVQYKLLPGPNKMLPKVFFARSRIDEFAPSAEILDIYHRGSFKKGNGFSHNDCHKLIDFFKDSIAKHEDWKNFDFDFSATEAYQDISEFYKEISDQGYRIFFKPVATQDIDRLVDEGKLYLFQIYNKDFSPHSSGKPSLHTMYWKALFDDENLKDVVYKLSGGAEMFYRKASIADGDKVVHVANKPIRAKNPNTPENENCFTYDIIKDRRYTTEKFLFHVPINMNFKSTGKTDINQDVRSYLKNNPDVHVIGIDRGERNLLYITLIDRNGKIVMDENNKPIQYSLNDIIGSYTKEGKEVHFTTPYQKLLDKREKERQAARENWGSIESIKDLKEGYISQVVSIISRLMVQYNAIVVMEDLNFGFKRGRFAVEKQVYQKFEKMLIEKLNYLVFKDTSDNQPGGLYHAYQLASDFESFERLYQRKQSGFIFYVPAWNTSKIDPATGFVDLLKPHYKNVTEAQNFFSKFRSIRYNAEENYFEFSFDYSDFTEKAAGTRTDWTVCTHGTVRYVWNKSLNNHKGGTEKCDVTSRLKVLFDAKDISYLHGEELSTQLAVVDDATFLRITMHLLGVTLAMRYSCAEDGKDFILSPVMGQDGTFFCSEVAPPTMPQDADANGAYHIAKKGLWALEQIDTAEDLAKVKLAVSNRDWLSFVQASV